MAQPFDGIAEAFAALLSTSPGVAGFILGFIVIVALCIIITWATGQMNGSGILIPAGIGVTFVALVGWWPTWTIIFAAIITALTLFHPWSE